MPVKLNINSFEKFTNKTATDYNEGINNADLAVDHCSLRPLSEIHSKMCEPTPIPTTLPPPLPTTKCIKPAVPRQLKQNNTGQECVLYRYESPEKIRQTIKETGYYIFRNMISPAELEIAKKYFYDHDVNYNRLKNEFINPFMLKKVGTELDKKLVNIKYRASNNNNSADAGAFHRDLHIKSGEKRVSCHTVLTYIDGGVMQLIPTSNRKQNIDIFDVKDYFNMREEIELNPGDVLMFEMATIHRGIFYKKQDSRRLIQLFDTVFEEDLDFFLRRVLLIPCGHKCNKKASDYLIKVNKNRFLSNMINSVSYYNTALGYSKLPMKYISSTPDVKYISTESNQPRVIVEDDTFQKDNYYCINLPTKDISLADRERFMFLSFFLNQILTLLLIIVLIAIVVLTVRVATRD